MVKGVNKNVIEINDTGSEIFERIVFYVSPKFCNISAKKLLKETEKFSKAFDYRRKRPSTLRVRMKRRRRRAIALAAAVVLAAAAALFAFL